MKASRPAHTLSPATARLRAGWRLAAALAAGWASGRSAPLTDLGPCVFGATTHAAGFGVDAAGRMRVYVLQDGALDGGSTPANLIVAEVESGRVEKILPLPAAEGGWGLTVASDGAVYAGVYRSGHLFRYLPGENQVTDLGRALPGQSFLYGLCAGEKGAVYGGTFPGAQVFRYALAEGFSRVGSETLFAGTGPVPTYVRAVGFDAARRQIYAGGGPGARVVRVGVEGTRAEDILPKRFSEADFPYAAHIAGNRFFLRLLSSEQAVVLDISQADQPARIEAEFRMTGLSFATTETAAYFTADRVPTAYEFATRTTRTVASNPWPANSYATTVVALKDQRKFPGKSVLGICNFGGRLWLAKTSLENGYTESQSLKVPPVAQTISSLLAGPDGKIYASGYLTGGTGVIDPSQPENKTPTRSGVSQCEGMTALGNRIYFGGYPGAWLYEYRPERPWTEGLNPRTLFNLKSEKQDRPFAMGHDGQRRVVMGTVPEYGAIGGALTIYDTVSGDRRTLNHRELGITDLSIVALACRDGVVYAGTSISGGLGGAPTQSRAKLLRYELDSGRSEAIALPKEIPNQTVISAVLVGPDRQIWLMVEGWLLVFDPDTRRFAEPVNLFPKVRYAPIASATVVKDASLLLARDGWVYGTISGKCLFKLDPRTRAATILSETDGGHDLVEDPQGRLYFTRGVSLYRYAR